MAKTKTKPYSAAVKQRCNLDAQLALQRIIDTAAGMLVAAARDQLEVDTCGDIDYAATMLAHIDNCID